MKTLKLTLSVVLVLFLASSSWLHAQTYQYEWRLNFNGDYGWCLNHPVQGYMIYHATIHLDIKTGVIDRVHNNIKQYDLVDLETGEKLVAIDTGNDNIGWWWSFWNDVTGAGLSLPADGEWPDEGKAIGSAFKFISKGGNVYSASIFFQLHRDASGAIKVKNFREVYDCN